MLVETTRSGTARRAFRKRNGQPLLGGVSVAGKTGSLSGKDPDGRYEWFIGVAPADAPRVAVAAVVVQRPALLAHGLAGRGRRAGRRLLRDREVRRRHAERSSRRRPPS